MNNKNFAGASLTEIHDFIGQEGYGISHARNIAVAIYRKRIRDISQITRIPKKLRLFLTREADIGGYPPEKSEISSDGSVKYLFRNRDGLLYETVYIPEGKRHTVCVSVQSGCRMGCPFCVTSKYGYHGNLSAGDIINQVRNIPPAEKLNHVVFMGMGEPLDNLDNVLKACTILTSEWGMAFSPLKITVSTVGIRPAFEKFLQSSGCNLTLSLFSPFSAERIKVIPAERSWPAGEIIGIMGKIPAKERRRVSVAYVMISGINDSERHLEGLKALLKGTRIRVNLLPYHNIPGDPAKASDEQRMTQFKHELVISGISASIRKSRGEDISAACGLLASGLKAHGRKN
ncbi:MAG: radical SAM protein [Bacteroidales bacterium]|jgi:23S rRNA (adenine2503-C2)-methyltransferase|nr:radical SAM protein [Bacteroidales bacterium]